jgi:hypothetical protein
MPGAISQKKRTEMLRVYCDRRSVQHVARVCSVSPTTALRYKRLDRWDARLKSVSKKAEEKIDDSLAEMQARQARQARAVQAKALQKILEMGFKSPKAAADAYFKATQEERVIRGEPSDRLNVVQEQMVVTGEAYERFHKLMRDPEFREIASRIAEIEMRIQDDCAAHGS